jgi:hypothetical protein
MSHSETKGTLPNKGSETPKQAEKQKSHSFVNLYILLLTRKVHTHHITTTELAMPCHTYILSPEKKNTILRNLIQLIEGMTYKPCTLQH